LCFETKIYVSRQVTCLETSHLFRNNWMFRNISNERMISRSFSSDCDFESLRRSTVRACGSDQGPWAIAKNLECFKNAESTSISFKLAMKSSRVRMPAHVARHHPLVGLRLNRTAIIINWTSTEQFHSGCRRVFRSLLRQEKSVQNWGLSSQPVHSVCLRL